jgi:hypothetical protein
MSGTTECKLPRSFVQHMKPEEMHSADATQKLNGTYARLRAKHEHT